MRMKRPAYAILRIDDFQEEGTPIENRVTVVQVRLEMEAAEREVERLSSLNGERGCRYRLQATRLVDSRGDGEPEPPS